MPYYPGNLKTLSLGYGLNPTIPQIFLYSTSNLYRQIIDEELYRVLLSSDISWVKLSTGDFLIMQSSAIDSLLLIIADYYSIPPPSTCDGSTLLCTFTNNNSRNLSDSLNSAKQTEIISLCFGRTILTTFINSNFESVSGQITGSEETEIL